MNRTANHVSISTRMEGHFFYFLTQWVLGQDDLGLRLYSMSWDAIEVRAVGDGRKEY